MGWPLVLYDGLALHRKPLWLQSVYIMKRDSPQKRAFFDDESPRRRMLLDDMVELLGQGVDIECESLSAAFLAECRRFSLVFSWWGSQANACTSLHLKPGMSALSAVRRGM